MLDLKELDDEKIKKLREIMTVFLTKKNASPREIPKIRALDTHLDFTVAQLNAYDKIVKLQAMLKDMSEHIGKLKMEIEMINEL
jgi:hypothetical protein